jgi:hypothetical protein
MPHNKMIERLQDLSSFDYKKVEASRGDQSNVENLPTTPTRVTEVETRLISANFSKLVRMDRGSNKVAVPNQDYLDTHRFNDGFGNIKLVALKSAEDMIRWNNWLSSDKGARFHIKQQALQIQNASRHTQIYNPIGLYTSVAAWTHAPRHGTWPLGLRLTDLVDPPTYENSPHTPATSKPMVNSDVTEGDSSAGAITLFGMRTGFGRTHKAKEFGLSDNKYTHIKVGTGKKLYSVGVSNQLQVPYGGTLGVTGTTDLPKDFIKFRIRDLVNGKWLIFPAHLGAITDTVTPSYTSEKYIGRPDSTHIYTGTDRSIGFDFKVAAFTKQEIPIIQEKMNYLVGLGYPSYKKLFDGDSESRPVAPYVSLTIGDLFNNTPGYFSSITVTMDEGATWELDEGFQIPQVFSVGVEFTYIGKYLPQTLGKHYEVPWLRDYGAGNQYGDVGTFVDFTNQSRPARETDGTGKFDGFKDQIDSTQNSVDYW